MGYVAGLFLVLSAGSFGLAIPYGMPFVFAGIVFGILGLFCVGIDGTEGLDLFD